MAGIRYAAMSPALGLVLSRSFVFGLGACAVPSLMPLIARDVVGGGPLTYGLLLGAFGVGAVAGAFLSGRLRRMLSSEGIVRASTFIFALTTVVGGVSSFLAITLIVLVAGGAAWLLALSTFNVTVQLQSPRWVVARALSLYQMAVFGGMASGSWMWGIVAEEQGTVVALAAAASVQLLCLLMGFRLPLPDAEALDLAPLRRWQAPDTAIPLDGRSGPVVIMIEYQIAPTNIAEFLGAMAERRRIRRRDGARHWVLLRDLSQPQIWIERFELPTWLDYIRHNSRMTHEDAPAYDRVRALHLGSNPPLVRRMIAPQTGVSEASGPDAREFGRTPYRREPPNLR